MISATRTRHILILCCFFLFFEGCVTPRRSVQVAGSLFPKIDAYTIDERMSNLQHTINSSNSDETRRSALKELALLYCHHQNPKPDYGLALILFEEYIQMGKHAYADDDVRTMVDLLKGLEMGEAADRALQQLTIETMSLKHKNIIICQKYKKMVTSQRQTIAKLNSDNTILSDEVASLKTTIERLKLLDVKLESRHQSGQ